MNLPKPIIQRRLSLLIRLLIVGLLILVAAVGTAVDAQAFRGPDEAKLQPRAVEISHYIQAHYPEVQAIGGWRRDPLPDHPSGRALDVMVPNLEVGDRIHADLQARAGELGITYMLWRQPKHWDHLHVMTR